MPFTELNANALRNLERIRITPSPEINIFLGLNGAGKTNLLELIYINSVGKSFRTHLNRSVIRDGADSCVVFAKYESYQNELFRIGVEKQRNNKQKVSINGVKQKALSSLARAVPVLAILPDELDLIDGSSALRRRYLDWVLFHVEPAFFKIWHDSQNLLKQRNHLLRTAKQKNVGPLEQKAWDLPFVELNEQLKAFRGRYVAALEDRINRNLACFPAFGEIRVNTSFFAGWATDKALIDVLEADYVSDLSRGFTGKGGHRADVLIQLEKQLYAKDILSRGQKKILAMVMRLAQAGLVKDIVGHPPVLLVDDLFAELDEQSAEAFCRLLENLGAQVFLSALEKPQVDYRSFFSASTKLFHVEQGLVKELP